MPGSVNTPLENIDFHYYSSIKNTDHLNITKGVYQPFYNVLQRDFTPIFNKGKLLITSTKHKGEFTLASKDDKDILVLIPDTQKGENISLNKISLQGANAGDELHANQYYFKQEKASGI